MKKILISTMVAALMLLCANVFAQTFAGKYGTKLVLGGGAAGTTPFTLSAPGSGSGYTLTLPTIAPSGAINGYALTTDASGTLSWSEVALGGGVSLTQTGGETYLTLSGQTLTANPIDLNSVNVTGVLQPLNGGTGVANLNANTITLGGPVSTSSSFTTTGGNITLVGQAGGSNVTLPTSGTLVASGSAAGGDLSGTYPNPTVSKINGNIIPSNLAGALVNDGSGTLNWTAVPTGSGTVSGTNTGDQTITLTSDVGGSGTGSFATTIQPGVVTLAKMSNLAANSIIGNNTGSAATPIALTVAQVQTMLGLTGTNSGDVTLTQTGGETYLTLTGQALTANPINLNSVNVTGVLQPANGGTGVANANTSTLTLGGPVTFAGTFGTGTTINVTGTTNITLPTSGTLATTTQLSGAVSGTPNTIPKFTSANVIGNSSITDDATNVATTENLLLSTAGKQLSFQGTGMGVSTFQAGAQVANTFNYTLPTGAPAANQVLSVQTVGVATPYAVQLYWATPSGGSGTPGGTTTQMQFNNAGAFGGTSGLVWDNTNSRLVVGGTGSGNTTLDVVKDFATREYAYATSLSGSNNDMNFDASGNQFGMVRLAAASASFTFNGFAGVANGKRMSIYNASGKTMIIANQSGAGTLADNIITGTGGNVTVGNGGTANLLYSNGDSRWILQSTSNGNSSSASGTALIAGNTAGNSATADFFDLGGSGQTATESSTQIVATRAATLGNLYVNISAVPGGATSKTVTVRVNGVNTTLTATVTAAATTANNTSNTVSVSAGDLISVQVTHTGAAANSTVAFGFEYANSAAGANSISFARRTSDVTLATASTALVNDGTLALTLQANTVYEFSGVVAYDGSNKNSDLKLAFTIPSGATMRWNANQGGNAIAPSSTTTSGTAISSFGCDNTPANNLSIYVSGVVVVGSTAGTLQLQEAQNTSSANSTTILTGSYLKATTVQ